MNRKEIGLTNEDLEIYLNSYTEVHASMAAASWMETHSIGGTLPEIAGYNKSGLTVVQMVTNRINARADLRGFNKDLVI